MSRIERPLYGRFTHHLGHTSLVFNKTAKRREDYRPTYYRSMQTNQTINSSKRFGHTKKYIIRYKEIQINHNTFSYDIKPIHPYHGSF